MAADKNDRGTILNEKEKKKYPIANESLFEREERAKKKRREIVGQ